MKILINTIIILSLSHSVANAWKDYSYETYTCVDDQGKTNVAVEGNSYFVIHKGKKYTDLTMKKDILITKISELDTIVDVEPKCDQITVCDDMRRDCVPCSVYEFMGILQCELKSYGKASTDFTATLKVTVREQGVPLKFDVPASCRVKGSFREPCR